MPVTQGPAEQLIRVLVIDDTRIHTQLLAEVLQRDRHLEVIAPPVRSRDLAETVKLRHVDVVVLSSNIDEEPLRGFELLRQLRMSHPNICAVMFLESSKREAVLRAFQAGARGIFSRHDPVESLPECIRSVHQGQIWANSQQVAFAVEALAATPVVRAVDSNGVSLLSKREMDVVRSLSEGLTNREIAERLGLSQHTIKNYLFRVYDKLGVSNRLELLFMTLTQNGTSNTARAAKPKLEPAVLGAERKIPHLPPANSSPAPHGAPVRRNLDGNVDGNAGSNVGGRASGTVGNEERWGTKAKIGTHPIGTDPLD
jgi:DNA-binding NarL/FixJ family response regulator